MAGVLTRARGPVHIESVLPDCEYLGDRPPTPPSRPAKVTVAVIATVVFLTAIAPLATDMYVPAFPAVAADLAATATQVQLTLTTFFFAWLWASWPVGRCRTSGVGGCHSSGGSCS